MEVAGSGSPPPPGVAGFSEALRRCSPPLPTSLLRRLGTTQQIGIGKIKVMLKVAGTADTQQGSYLSVDVRRRQVTVFDSSSPNLPEDRRLRVIAPKVFAFDAIFTPSESQVELCSSVLSDIICAVMNGTDGCVFSFGHTQLDKGETMFGKHESCGLIPTAVAWLYRCVSEQRLRTTTRYGIRISAVELTHRRRDLLAMYASVSGEEVADRTDTLTEVRAGSMQQAAACLDAALAQRSSTDSYLLVTLHLYKHSSSGGPVGRSRLHLLDLCGGGNNASGCDQKGSRSDTIGMMPSSIGNILLAILNGQKHLPYRDQVLTHTLKDCLGSLRCQAAMIAHVSQSSAHHQDTTATIQLASRIHRLRRRRFKMVHSIVTANEEIEHRLPESVDPSSSEQSADTVIYLGPGETETDGEHPPVYLHGLLTPSTSTPNSPQRSVSKNSSRSAKSSPARSKTKPLLNGGEEKWIDGPKIPKSKLVEARNIVLHKDRSGQKETWVDGPNGFGYGMMDYSKRNMIRRWVENQSVQVQAQKHKKEKLKYRELTTFKKCNVDSIEQRGAASGREDSTEDEGPPVPVTATETLPNEKNTDISRVVPIQRLQALGEESNAQKYTHDDEIQEDEVETELEMKEDEIESKESSECDDNLDDEDIDDDEDEDDEEIIVVEEPTELVPMQDCCLQVTEEDIALCMGEIENPLPEVDQEGQDHPLRILSQENLTIMSSLTGLVDERWQTELGQNDEDNASIVSEPLYYSNKSNEEVYCHNCKLSLATASTKRHYHLNSLNRLSKSISMLRHPDGSSNPNLSGLGLDDGWKQKDRQDPLRLQNDQDDSDGLNVTVPPLPPLHSTVMNLSTSSGYQYSSVQSRNTFLRQMNNHSRNIHDPGGTGDWYSKRLQQLRQLRSELADHQRLQRLSTNPASWMCNFSMQESWLQRDHMS